MEKLTEYANCVLKYGPERIVIADNGEAVSSQRAMERGVFADVIFIRNDGWSLGAPRRFAATAYGAWHDHWIGFLEKPNQTPKPISEYHLG